MKKLIAILSVCSFAAATYAQELTVNKLEQKWRTCYQLGCEHLEKTEYESAEGEIQKSLELIKSNGAVNTNSYIYSLLKLAEIYHESGDKEKLKQVETQIMHLGNSIKPSSVKYLNYVYCLSIYYSNTSQYNKAIEVIDHAIADEALMAKSADHKYKLIHRKALCYYCMENLTDAIATERSIVEVESPSSPDFLQSFVYYLYKNNDEKEMDRWIRKCFDVSREPMLRKFARLQTIFLTHC